MYERGHTCHSIPELEARLSGTAFFFHHVTQVFRLLQQVLPPAESSCLPLFVIWIFFFFEMEYHGAKADLKLHNQSWMTLAF